MKNLQNLGVALTKVEQKTINGGQKGCPPAKIKVYDPNEVFECGGDTGLYCSNNLTCCYGYCV
ncbi:hypothetical protein BZARG_920 [Bizionia argentinensis JUB59]|uniref:Uncharacterized protein n=1 Tax=Bizionia argentinensis JUB59 TaxID=1046627 RepID=G2EBP1_9FLAO|nr:hypothetical protein [Bizionia argentinensis]EGV44211.1 hypothetical protein BZARG_920 [Bizionia argentinensis JUB59]